MQHSPDRDGADLDLDGVFSDPAFAALKARCAAFMLVDPAERSVVWANGVAARHWGAADLGALSRSMFGTGGADGGWLDGLLQGIVPGRAPRLARGGLSRGFRMRARTAMVQAFSTPDTALVAIAVPDAMAPEAAAAEDWKRPAWELATTPDAPAAEPAPSPAAAPETPEDDPGASIARRSQLAVIRDRLNHAFDGAASLRLLWRTDAAGAVTRIDADAFSRLGSPVRFDRRTFPDVVQDFDPAGADRLRRALASRATWAGITLDLPVAAGAARVPMALSGSPVFGPGRLFAGFRGFGTIDLGRLDLPAPRPEAAPHPEPDTAPPPAPTDDAGPAEATPSAPLEAEPSPPEPASEPSASPALPLAGPRVSGTSASIAPPPANVVQLRAFQALAPGRPAPAPAHEPIHKPEASSSGPPEPTPAPEEAPATARAFEDSPAVEEAPSEAALGDDLAFLALGEALRARIGAPIGPIDGASPAPPPDARAVEPAAHVPPADAAPDAAARLVDLLPMALIVMAGGAPAFANAAASARLGYPTPADLTRVGEDFVVSGPSDAGDAVLRGADRGPVPVAVRQVVVDWDGVAASLWTLVEPDAAPASPTPVGEPEDRAGELLDRVDDAVALLDGTGLVRRLNRRGEGWFGHEGAIGQSFTQLLAPESRPAAVALLGEVRAQRDGLGAPPSRRDVLARTGEAAPVPMAMTLGRLGAAGFYLTLRDMTALKHAETERATTERDQARDAGRLPGLLGKVSHEIRTPLNAILGFAEVMMDERFGPLGNPRYRDYLKDIHTSGLQVMTLVEDLLDLSRIEAGQIDLAVAALDVNRIVAETVAQMQPEAHRERVIMRTSLGGRIPSVLADERSARQIVRNLLSNAVKFNEPGGQVIVSTAVSETGTVLLRVRDTGVGMTDDEIAAALEPFGGLPSPHPANGNGLGLPLTRALVGANGASMAIRSRPQEGTLVEVAFTSAAPEAARRPA